MLLSQKIKLYKRVKIEDNRGWFLKVINGKEENLPAHTGEIYVTVAKNGEMKGGHYHNVANEWFCLIKGKCILKVFDIESKESQEFKLDDANPVTIFIPQKVAHAFFNFDLTGNSEFILLAYTDKLYDPIDTIPYNFN